jgi:2-oxoglutarate ferredoxin oxidoreductase subunit delta
MRRYNNRMIQINKDACKGCGICIAMCPVKILEFSNDLNKVGVHYPKVIDETECTECENCMIYCPDFAMVVIKNES